MKLQRTLMALSGIAMLTGLAAPVNAQALDRRDLSPANPAVAAPGTEGMGYLVFSSKIQDTGEILDSEPYELNYLFRNTGQGPLTITQVKTSCGCTVPELEKKTYMPGESGEMKVTFDPSGKSGAMSRNITVFTDSQRTPSETLIVRTLVKPVVVMEPRVLPFDSIEKGQTATKEFKIYGRTDDFKVTRATVDRPGVFDIEVEDKGEVDYHNEKLRLSVIRVTVRPDARPGSETAEVTVRTNDERRPIFSLSVVARVLGDLKINPVRVTMGRMTVGDEFEREIRITSKSGKAFEIKGVGLNTIALDTKYEFKPTDETKTEWVVTLTGKVANAALRFNTQLHLTTDVPDEEQLTVQMYGQLRAQ